MRGGVALLVVKNYYLLERSLETSLNGVAAFCENQMKKMMWGL